MLSGRPKQMLFAGWALRSGRHIPVEGKKEGVVAMTRQDMKGIMSRLFAAVDSRRYEMKGK